MVIYTHRLVGGLLAVLLLAGWAHAEVHVAGIFADHMVLQRDMKVPVWGTAEPGERVTVTIAGQSAEDVADEQGKWEVRLKPMAVSNEPLEMTVRGNNVVSFQDILVGDVWICAGQSNMQIPLRLTDGFEQTKAQADFPRLRMALVDFSIDLSPREDCRRGWLACGPQLNFLQHFTAVGYYFGKELLQTQNIPIGLIETCWGGTPAEAWTSLEMLQSVPELAHYAEAFKQRCAEMDGLMETYEKVTLPAWKEAMAQWEAQPQPKPEAPKKPWPPNKDIKLPTALFNGMINPIIAFGIKGVIWYQGEGNAHSVEQGEEYAVLFPALIADWRKRWGQGDFPFLYVQLSSWFHGGRWPTLRNSQLKTLAVPNTGMAVTIDTGEKMDIHPKNKQDVGHRLALVARRQVYGEDIVSSGPMYRSMMVEGNKAVISFAHLGSGLKIGVPPLCGKDKGPASSLQAFEIAGADGKFVPAEAVIEGDTVVVSAKGVAEPKAVRYAWSGWPEPPANLYNRESLPAVPFNTEYPVTSK